MVDRVDSDSKGGLAAAGLPQSLPGVAEKYQLMEGSTPASAAPIQQYLLV